MKGLRGFLVGLVAVAGMTGACSSSPSVPSTAVTRSEITSAFQTLFNMKDKAVDAKLAVVQNGGSLRTTMSQALASPMADEAVGATVQSVQLLSDDACRTAALPSPCASVGYSIELATSSGSLPGLRGYAVYLGGHWLVARSTICDLLAMENNGAAPAGCSGHSAGGSGDIVSPRDPATGQGG